MYPFVLLLLLFGTFFEVYLNKRIKQWYFIMSFILLIMLCFRYGQGTDYFAYSLQYRSTNISMTAREIIRLVVHGEPGWRLLMWASKKIGLSFEIFIMMISGVMMCGSWKIIKKHSPYKTASLLLLYPTYYLTYYNSALRQGLVLAFFLGLGIQFLLKENYKNYCILVLVLSFFHGSAIVLFLLPLLLILEKKKMERIVYIPLLIIMLIGYSGAGNLLVRFFPSATDYLGRNIRISAIILRIIIFTVIYFLHKKVDFLKNVEEETLFRLYKYGFFIFLALSFAANLSQRVTMPIKAIEIVLIPLQYYLLRNNSVSFSSYKPPGLKINNKTLISLTLVVLMLIPPVEYIKNINAYLIQGEYVGQVNAINYPYISIFEKDSIRNYRNDSDWTYKEMVD